MKLEIFYTKELDKDTPAQTWRMRGEAVCHPERCKGEWVRMANISLSREGFGAVYSEGWVHKKNIIDIVRIE